MPIQEAYRLEPRSQRLRVLAQRRSCLGRKHPTHAARQHLSLQLHSGMFSELNGMPRDMKNTTSSPATICLDRKHPLAIRWMHWVNFPVLSIMIWSGLLIYWNVSDNAYQHPHAIYRIGIGKFTLFRFFPNGFWRAIDAPYHVTQGLGHHFFFMWIFAANGVAYVTFLVLSGEWRFLIPQKQSLRDAIQVTLVDLHLRNGLPPQTKYNGAQRIAYSMVILMGFGMLLTGLAIYKPTQLHLLTTILGGYEMARWEHFWITMGFVGFFVIHIVQVILAGWNNFRSMVSGLEVKSVDDVQLEAERRSW